MNGDDYTTEGAAEMRDELAKAETESGSRGATCSLVLYSGEGTITVTRHPDGKATIEMFDQRTICDLIDKEDRIKLAEFLAENE